VGAGAALGAGAGQAGGTSSTAAGASGGSAPIEVQIMAYKGLSEIAADIAAITANSLCNAAACPDNTHSILIEEPGSSLQIALYQSVLGYHNELGRLVGQLNASFSLLASIDQAQLTSAQGHDTATLTVVALDGAVLKGISVSLEGENSEVFSLYPATCPEVSASHPCKVAVHFNHAGSLSDTHLYKANIRISTDTYRWNHALPISGKYSPKKLVRLPSDESLPEITSIVAGFEAPSLGAATTTPTTTGGGASGATGGAGASSTPLSLTYLSGIGTALAGIKTRLAYSSSTAQPTTQSFEVLVENELRNR